VADQLNIIFLMPDQLRHDFLSCYGADFIDTPNIDALCERGIRYERAYSEHPVCVPARAALLTGMNSVKAGVLDNSQWLRPDYRQCGLRTWPEILSAQGYYTLATGKMHFYPWQARFGFQRRIIALPSYLLPSSGALRSCRPPTPWTITEKFWSKHPTLSKTHCFTVSWQRALTWSWAR